MAAPAVGPYPGRMFTTPGGIPTYEIWEIQNNQLLQLCTAHTLICFSNKACFGLNLLLGPFWSVLIMYYSNGDL